MFMITFYILLMVQWFPYVVNDEEDKRKTLSRMIEVPLTKINNNYFGIIVVGTPEHGNKQRNKQAFTVNFDTGSQHLWLMTTEVCPASDCKGVKFTPYDKKKSSTYSESEIKDDFKLEYTDGTVVKGKLGLDVVQLGLKDAVIDFTQTIGFAREFTGIVKDCDGIFGLGMISENLFPGDPGPDPPLWTLNKKYGIEEFGIYMARVLSGDGAGKIVFGGHDESVIEGELHFHDVQTVNDDGDFDGYKIKIDKVIVQKGKHRIVYPTPGMLALPDSGNNVIIGPQAMFTSIRDKVMSYSTFEHTDSYSFRCNNNLDELPDIIFVMDGHEYVMYPLDYTWTLPSGELCKLGVFARDTDHIVLGQIFMQTFYTKFNVVKQTVGFARAKHPTSTSTPTGH